MSVRYELAVLTHGDGRTLAEALAAFRAYVDPPPTRIRVFADGVADVAHVVAAARGTFPDVADQSFSATYPSRQAGFCGATARLWDAASRDGGVDFVFWLEHDFLVERPVSVEQLAAALLQDPSLAQMALVRGAENADERAAGGLIESRPGAFERRRSEVDGLTVEWLEHRSFLTTNPSLMRGDFMAENPWPEYPVECEGRFGIDLVERGYRFGYWGDGTPYVRHVGVRDGSGHSY